MIPQLPPPGAHDFFPALLSAVKEHSVGQLPVDPVVLQSLLLCLIPGSKNLILRVPEEDINHVVKLVTLTLNSNLGLHAHKVKIRPTANEHPNAFLKNLFLKSVYSTNHDDSLSSKQQRRSHGASKHASSRRHGHARSRPNSARSPLSTSGFVRSHSSPEIFPADSDPFRSPEAEEAWQRLVPAIPHASIGNDGAYSDTATEVAGAHSNSTRAQRRPSNRQSHTDPLPVSQPGASGNLPSGGFGDVPQALVVSGLEHAGTRCQRALLDVLVQRKIVLDQDEGYASEDDDGVWNLPDGFMMVYVCTMDPKDRPHIHKTLLDKFSMSANVNLHPSSRLSLRSSSFTHTLNQSEPIQSPTSLKSSFISPDPPIILSPYFIESTLRTSFTTTRTSPSLSLYTSDLLSAVRHHPQLDGTFITLRAHEDAQDMIRAARVLGGDLTGIELIASVASQLGEREAMPDDANVSLQNGHAQQRTATMYSADGNEYAAAYEGVSEEDATFQRSLARTMSSNGLRDAADAGSVVESLGEMQERYLDVSEADVARMIPRVISHRLRVRDGPQDEVLGSALFGAVEASHKRAETPTVKDVLVRILAEV